jgi:hypothetical protein
MKSLWLSFISKKYTTFISCTKRKKWINMTIMHVFKKWFFSRWIQYFCNAMIHSHFVYYVLLFSPPSFSTVRIRKKLSFRLSASILCVSANRQKNGYSNDSFVEISYIYASTIDCSNSNGVISFVAVMKESKNEKRKKEYSTHQATHLSFSNVVFVLR